MEFRKAQRHRVRARIGIVGPSGSGKTMSALLLAYGLVGDWGKVALVDTEMGSGELYVGAKINGLTIGEYQCCRIEPPYTVEKYIDAMRAAESMKEIEVIIIDSATHAWAGSGGLLDRQGKIADASKSKNTWTAWRTITPLHNQFVDMMLQTRLHLITTLRSKTEYAQSTDASGRAKIEKLGMAPIQREGFEYEFTVMFDLDMNHIASTSKDRTMVFDGQFEKISDKTGKKFLEWANTGTESTRQQPVPPAPQTPPPSQPLPEQAKEIKEELAKAFEGSMNKEEAEQPATPPPPSQPPSAPAQTDEKKIQPAQLKYIMTKITTLFVKTKKCDMETVKTCLKDQFKIEHMNEIKATQFNAAIEWLEEFAKEEEKPK